MAKRKTEPADSTPQADGPTTPAAAGPQRARAGRTEATEREDSVEPVNVHYVLMSKPPPGPTGKDKDLPDANVHLDFKVLEKAGPPRDAKKPDKANAHFEVKQFVGRPKGRPAPSIGSMQVPGKR